MKSITWFEELGKNDVGIAGGKGANLGELVRAGMPVPPGFVVTAETFMRFLETNNLKDDIYSRLKIDVEDTTTLQQAAAEVKKLVTEATIPVEVSHEIVEAYKKLCMKNDIIISGKKDVPVAIRSSATAEDLPGASFAGQQATFLGVKGSGEVLKAVQECWASLFEPRSIYYRVRKGFAHEKVSIAVIVQKMVISDKAGVMFTIHPATGDQSTIVIEAGFGLGESVVSGSITPDTYVVDKESLRIKQKEIAEQEWLWEGSLEGGKKKKDINPAMRKEQKISDVEIAQIAKLGSQIEEHYAFPQDIEWCIEKGKSYIVQSRPVTAKLEGLKDVEETLNKPAPKKEKQKKKKEKPNEHKPKEPKEEVKEKPKEPEPDHEEPKESEPAPEPIEEEKEPEVEQEEEPTGEKEILVKGLAASPGLATGKVVQIKDSSELSKVKEGNILVAEMTDPSMVPAMEKAAAIVTNEGGLTAHAAIVSRELRIPCVVGTQTATEVLEEGMTVTVDAVRGIVYRGKVEVEEVEEYKAAEPTTAATSKAITGTKVKVNIDFPKMAQDAENTGADGVGLLRAEHMIITLGKHPSEFIKEGEDNELVDKLTEGIQKVAEVFHPKPVWYRTLDAPTDEFRGLEGGEDEPEEANPMLGWRGIRRGLDQPDLLKAEFRALKKVYEAGSTHLGVMIPLVQNAEEVAQAKKIAEEVGLPKDMEFGVMIETPAAALTADELVQQDIDFISFGTNDLTQYTLAVDRDNGLVAKKYNPMHPAILRQIEYAVKICQEAGVKTSICGQAGSDPEMVKFLVRLGIDSISANIDSVGIVREVVVREETKLLLELARKRHEEQE